MPVCDAGSERQPGTPASVTVDPLFAASLMPVSLSWIFPFLPFMQPFTLSLDDFCGLDPPADPGITATDLINLLPPSPWSVVELASFKVAQLVHIFAWYRFCRCIDLAIPDPFTPPSAPSDLPALNPPGYVAPGAGGTPCQTNVFHFDFPAATTTTQNSAVLTYPVGSALGRMTVAMHTTDWDLIAFVRTDNTNPMSSTTVQLQVGRNVSDGTYFGDGTPTGANWVNFTPGQTPYFRVDCGSNGGIGAASGPASVDIQVDWYCGTSSPTDPGDYAPCIPCPPDPFLTAQLSNLMARLAVIQGQVDLIQRQAVPFGYIAGAVHAGITGAGSLAVSGLIGCQVEVTSTLGSTIGGIDGNPDFLYGLGWLNWGSDDGVTQRQLLQAGLTLSLPSSAGAYTFLHYSLAPGVTVTVTELVREP